MGLDFSKMPDQPKLARPTLGASPVLRDADPKRLNNALIHSETLGLDAGQAYEDSDLINDELKKVSRSYAAEREQQQRAFGLESLKQYGAYIPWLGLSAFKGLTSYFLENIFFFKQLGTDKAIAEAIEYWREKTGPDDLQIPDFGFEFKDGKLRLRPTTTPVKDITGATAEILGAVAGPIGAAFRAGRLVISKFAAEAGSFYQSIARGMVTGALLGEGRKEQTLENMALFGVFEPIAYFLGRASEVPGRIRKTETWVKMTAKDKGLMILELDEVNARAAEYLEVMKGRGATSETLEWLANAKQEEIFQRFRNPAWRDAATKRQVELETARKAEAETIRKAEADEAIRAKAREEGRPEPEVPVKIFGERKEELKESRPDLTGAELDEIVGREMADELMKELGIEKPEPTRKFEVVKEEPLPKPHVSDRDLRKLLDLNADRETFEELGEALRSFQEDKGIPLTEFEIKQVVQEFVNDLEIEAKEPSGIVEIEPEVALRIVRKEEPPGVFVTPEGMPAIEQPIPIEDITEFRQVQAEARRRAEENIMLRQKAELGKAEAAERKAAAEMLKREEIPVYAAMDEAVKHGGLNRDDLLKEFLEEDVNALSRKRPGLVRKGGPVRIDLLGERHGFEREMFSAMLEAPTKKQFIERAGEKFREEFPAEEIELDEGMILEEEINVVNEIMSARKPKPALKIKKTIRELTGQVRVDEPTITEYDALRASFKKAAQNARIAFREGNKGGLVTERARMRKIFNSYKEVVKRSREVNAFIKEMKQTRKRLKKGDKNLALEFQKLLAQTIEGLELSKSKYANLEKAAKGLKVAVAEFAEPLTMAGERVDEINRLAEISGKDFTSDDVKSLRDQIKDLKEAGKIRAKMDMKYDEILRNLALEKLYPSTHPMDPKRLGKKATNFEVIRAGTWWFYIQTLHTPRVTQIADGRKIGENTRLLRTLADGETESKILTRDRMVQIYERLGETDITPAELEDLTSVPGGKMAQRINVNLVNDRPNSESQVKELLEKYGMEEVPPLNDREIKILNILRESVGARAPEVKATYEEVRNQIFYDEENYWPFKYEQEFGVEPGDAIKHDRHRKSRTEQGFTVRRLKGVKQTPRDDLLNVLEEAVNEQEWFIALEPRLENLRSLLMNEEYRAVAGDTLFNWWKNQLDIVARRGWSANATFNEGTAFLRQSRHNLNVAILGYKLSSIVMQPFATVDAMAYVLSKHGIAAAAEVLGEVMKAWALPGFAKDITDISPALQLRMGGELAIEETLKKIGRGKKPWERFQLESMTLLRKADLRTAAGAESAFIKIFERLGVEEPLKEAEFVMNMTQGSADTVYRPQILASGEIARTAFTFQTFFLNRWGLIAEDIIATGLLKGEGWKMKYNAALALAILMAAGLAEDEIREFIYEFTTGKDLPDQSMLYRLLLYLPSQAPLLGRVLERGDFSVPIISVVEKLIRGPVQIVTGKDGEAKLRGVLKTAEGLATLFVGIPGTAQTFDIIERMVLGDKRKPKRRIVLQ